MSLVGAGLVPALGDHKGRPYDVGWEKLQEDDKRVGFCSLLRMDDDTVELHETVWVPKT